MKPDYKRIQYILMILAGVLVGIILIAVISIMLITCLYLFS